MDEWGEEVVNRLGTLYLFLAARGHVRNTLPLPVERGGTKRNREKGG